MVCDVALLALVQHNKTPTSTPCILNLDTGSKPIRHITAGTLFDALRFGTVNSSNRHCESHEGRQTRL
jgi:hypothetical protein